MVLLLCALSVAGLDEAWIEVLRDAQIANQSALEQGEAELEIEYLIGKAEKGPVEIRVEVMWHKDLEFARSRIHDPYVAVDGRPGSDRPLDEQPWSLRLRGAFYAIGYNPETKLAVVRDIANAPGHPLLQWNPYKLWLRCCPPFSTGRPWPEMVGPLPLPATESPSIVEFEEVSPGLIRQIRHDPDGSVAEIDFSLEACGNPIRVSYQAGQERFASREVTLRWKTIGAACVLESYEQVESEPGRPNQVANIYRLRTRNVRLGAVPDRVFTPEHLLSLAGPDAKIDDMTSDGRWTRTGGGQATSASAVGEEDLRRLSDVVRSRGFAQP